MKKILTIAIVLLFGLNSQAQVWDILDPKVELGFATELKNGNDNYTEIGASIKTIDRLRAKVVFGRPNNFTPHWIRTRVGLEYPFLHGRRIQPSIGVFYIIDDFYRNDKFQIPIRCYVGVASNVSVYLGTAYAFNSGPLNENYISKPNVQFYRIGVSYAFC